MIHLFTDEIRRNPYPMYAHMREKSPLYFDSSSGLWMAFDFATVRQVLNEHETFSSRTGPPEWLVFTDPPRHRNLRALVSQAFTPRSIVNLETRIREICRQLIDGIIDRGEMDLATDLAIPLPVMVIAEMLGLPPADRAKFTRWNDAILDMSHTIGDRSDRAKKAGEHFLLITGEMDQYLSILLQERRAEPKEDLLTRLLQSEIEGERLTHRDILGFFQGLLLAGSETTTNLLNNAMLCFVENPDSLATLRSQMDLLPAAIEEVIRYRSPLQWMFRVTARPVELHGQTIPPGKLVLAVIGSANHDAAQFPDPETFDIRREPNGHLAFGVGGHFCIGAPLARLESRVALTELLSRMSDIELASREPWAPGGRTSRPWAGKTTDSIQGKGIATNGI